MNERADEGPGADGRMDPGTAERGSEAGSDDELMSRLEVIESQPLEQRVAGFDQLAEELLAELQRSDHEGSATP